MGIGCYTSTDLYNWKNLGLVLPAVKDDPAHELYTGKINVDFFTEIPGDPE